MDDVCVWQGIEDIVYAEYGAGMWNENYLSVIDVLVAAAASVYVLYGALDEIHAIPAKPTCTPWSRKSCTSFFKCKFNFPKRGALAGAESVTVAH